MYTVEKMDGRWWVIEPNIGGRAISDSLYESDARRIARALNMEAAMGEVWEAAIQLLAYSHNGAKAEAQALREALAALDAAGKDTQ